MRLGSNHVSLNLGVPQQSFCPLEDRSIDFILVLIMSSRDRIPEEILIANPAFQMEGTRSKLAVV